MRDWKNDPPEEERLIEVTIPSGDIVIGTKYRNLFWPGYTRDMYAYYLPLKWRYI